MFAEYAPKYWEKGLPVMPLRPQAKIPALPAWQALCASMPSPEQQEQWLAAYPDGNMGLPLGPQAGIIALDLDSEDPKVLEILDRLMPASPWKRIGKKGAIYAFKYNGERTYRIRDEEGKTILEVLSRGAQMVLPPSIHPDTGQPYRANAELVDVLDRLVGLPADFETKVRQALIDAGFKLSSRGATKVAEWVPAGGRDSAMTAMAGLLARSVLRKERTLLEALNEAEAWVVNYTEKVVGDTLDPEKARRKVLEFLRRDIVEARKQLPNGWDAGLGTEDVRQLKEYFGEEAEEWTVQQHLDFLEERFRQIPRDDVPKRQEVIEEVLVRMARSEHLSSIDQEIIISFIQNGSSRMIATSAIRKRLRELQQGEVLGNDHTEIAEALMREMEREGEIRFSNGCFYQWYGAYWRRLDDAEIMRRLAQEFGDLPACRRFSDHKGIIQVAQKLKAGELRTLDTTGINFANGYLNDDLQLLEHDPRFGATYCLPYRWAPDDRAPAMFMGFLDQCWGHDPDYLDKVQALREAIAVTLFGQATRFQRAICLYGVAGSGKTTLMDIVLGLIPADAVSNVPPQDWGDKFLPTQMAGKLMNSCGELPESQMIPGNAFKMIVEGSELNGQFKGRDIFRFKPICAHWFATNHLPRSRDTSAGFTRRWLILQFTRAVPSDQKRIGLAQEILAEEREAIVAWAASALQGVIRRSDYTIPSSHTALVSEVAALNNSARFFLSSSEGLMKDPEGQVTERAMYELYYTFCKLQANTQPVTLKRFRMIMQDLQSDFDFTIVVEHENGVEKAVYRGYRLAKPPGR